MRNWITLVVALLLLASSGAGAGQITPEERDGLRAALEQRFDIVPLSDAIGLRPKARMGDVRLIEVADTITINGVTVTGRELRDRVGRDADAILRLSYLDAAARRQLFAAPASAAEVPAPSPPATPEPAVEQPAAPSEPTEPTRPRRTARERVRIFGDVHVAEDEVIREQVVAVMGSVRVDGEVGDQVVAVMGSVHLGPRAVVRGDIVSVGGRVHREPGAQVRGDVTEVAIGGGWPPRSRDWPDWHIVGGPGFGYWGGFGAVPRLVGSTFRLLLLALLAAVTLLVARGVVESAAERLTVAPAHSTVVGVAAILLLGPLLFLVSLVLVISIVGLPLLVAMPFLLLAILLMALAGFSGTAYAVGQWTRRRLGGAAGSPFLDVSLGVFVILLPVLLGRVIALAGFWGGPIATLLLVVGFMLEFLAWSAGFGAVLTNAFGRWQARRAARTPVAVATPAAPPPNVGP